MPAPVAEKTQLATLAAVSQALAGTLRLEGALHRVLELLARHHAMFPSLVTLLKGTAEEPTIAAAHGLTPRGKQARYRLGEGIAERATGSGRPIIVPRVSHEPRFPNRAGQRRTPHQQDRTFICVPVEINRKVVGSLGVDLSFKGDGDYDRELHFVQVAASMIAQAIGISHVVESDKDRLRDENEHLREELRERYDFSNIIGRSNRMRQVYERIAQAAPANASVLIRGEPGTGKELIARAIHYHSVRAKRPFVKASCAALPETLIEAELFGHEKGASTGTDAGKNGCFELADGGTLFLDEIGDLSLTTQEKLLRVLQDGECERLGGTTAIKANVRLITATNRDLETAIADGSFRDDLYQRLNVQDFRAAAARAPRRRAAAGRLLFGKVCPRVSQADQADFDGGDRHAGQLSLAGQRAGIGECHRACRAGVRRAGHSRLPPAAHAADRRSVRHPVTRVAQRGGGRFREGSADGCAEDRTRQPGQGRQTSRHHRAHHAYKVKKYAIDCNRFRN